MKNWTLKITVSVSDTWVADGFNLSERIEEIEEAIVGMLPYAYEHEIEVKATVTKAPSEKAILSLQNGDVEIED